MRLLSRLLSGVDVLIVHEWNPPKLVRAAGRLAAAGEVLTFFHDTHYRAVTRPDLWRRLKLHRYSGVLAFSPALRAVYQDVYGVEYVHIFHEGADTHVFQPLPAPADGPLYDVVFIGNWGDDDRAASMQAYLFDVAAALPRHRFLLHGVRYTPEVLAALARSGIRYGDWVANAATPAVYAAARVAVHIPRQPYLEMLPGTPTIRIFEALACGRALISLPWADTDGLFTAGRDYLEACSPAEMTALVKELCADDARREALGAHGLTTVRARHTCAHRAAELLQIVREAAERA
jgi:spore maturation protein CgeB